MPHAGDGAGVACAASGPSEHTQVRSEVHLLLLHWRSSKLERSFSSFQRCSSLSALSRVAMADAEKKVFSLEEVSGHNHSRDCWLVIGGKVYDVTKFLEEHPGGDEVLLSATGKDATDDFEDVGHSTSARAMMDEYEIGEIDPSTIPSKPTYTPAKQASYNPDKSSEFLIKILQFVVPLAILALAVAVRLLTKNENVNK